jgi:hypothetical protein
MERQPRRVRRVFEEGSVGIFVEPREWMSMLKEEGRVSMVAETVLVVSLRSVSVLDVLKPSCLFLC